MIVNGKEVLLEERHNLGELLDDLKVDIHKVVVEIDGEIICKDDFYKTKLKESNVIEVVSFVGGG